MSVRIRPCGSVESCPCHARDQAWTEAVAARAMDMGQTKTDAEAGGRGA